MIKLFSAVTNKWNIMFKKFLSGDKNEKMRLLASVMDVYGFPSLKKEQNDAANAIADFINSLSMKEYFHLENVYRCWNYEWETDKKKFSNWNIDNMFPCIMRIKNEDEKRAVLILGCMSANGYLRQKCLRELVYYKDSFPFLLLRLNDWVKEVRADAFDLSLQRMQQAQAGELLLALPVIEKLRESYRKEDEDFEKISESFYLRLMESIRGMSFCEIDCFDQTVRNAFYRLINNYAIYEKDRLLELLKITKGNFESRMVIHALVKYYDMSEQDFQHYLKNKNGIIRRYAIEKWTAKHGIWNGAEQYLLDRSKSVRLNVQYLIQKYTDMDVVHYYMDQLNKEKFKIAIDGLGETGDKETVTLLLPYLEDSDWIVQRKALRAIGSLLKEEGEEYYLQFLYSKNHALAKTAYQQCYKWDVVIDIETLMDMYEHSEDEQKKCYYLLLLRKCPFWDCVAIYLKLYGRVSEKQQAIISGDVSVRPMYQQLTTEKGNKIKHELEMNRDYLPEWLYKGVLFDVDHLMR